jgi:hypothetical protein
MQGCQGQVMQAGQGGQGERERTWLGRNVPLAEGR